MPQQFFPPPPLNSYPLTIAVSRRSGRRRLSKQDGQQRYFMSQLHQSLLRSYFHRVHMALSAVPRGTVDRATRSLYSDKCSNAYTSNLWLRCFRKYFFEFKPARRGMTRHDTRGIGVKLLVIWVQRCAKLHGHKNKPQGKSWTNPPPTSCYYGSHRDGSDGMNERC